MCPLPRVLDPFSADRTIKDGQSGTTYMGGWHSCDAVRR
jgi:hypothetical protein